MPVTFVVPPLIHSVGNDVADWLATALRGPTIDLGGPHEISPAVSAAVQIEHALANPDSDRISLTWAEAVPVAFALSHGTDGAGERLRTSAAAQLLRRALDDWLFRDSPAP